MSAAATAAPAVRQDGPHVGGVPAPVRVGGIRFRCVEKTASEGTEWNLHRKAYVDFKTFDVKLECRTPAGVAGTLEMRYMSEANAKGFEIGQDVFVNFSPAPPVVVEVKPAADAAGDDAADMELPPDD